MHFLLVSPMEFLTKQVEKDHPFGKTPWICFNAASDHYEQAVITDCKVHWGTQGYLVGTFTCTCGFVYSRRGPDEKEEERYKIGQIKSYGPLWEKELYRLRKVEQKTIKETAHILHVTPLTITRKLKKIEGNPQILTDNQARIKTLIKYRSKWIQVTKDNLGLTNTGLRELAKKEYIWLYRHDRIWLDENSPCHQKKSNGGIHVSWEERDKTISIQTKNAVKELLLINSSERPIRLTRTSIGKKAGDYSKIMYGLEKMPLTKKILSESVETVEDFQIRRVKWAVKLLQEKSEIVTPNKIRKIASLQNPKLTEKVKQQIEIVS